MRPSTRPASPANHRPPLRGLMIPPPHNASPTPRPCQDNPREYERLDSLPQPPPVKVRYGATGHEYLAQYLDLELIDKTDLPPPPKPSSAAAKGSDKAAEDDAAAMELEEAEEVLVTLDNIKPKLKVVRSSAWTYRDHDGGAGCVGVVLGWQESLNGVRNGDMTSKPITSDQSKCGLGPYARVQWEANKYTDIYPIGHADLFFLAIAPTGAAAAGASSSSAAPPKYKATWEVRLEGASWHPYSEEVSAKLETARERMQASIATSVGRAAGERAVEGGAGGAGSLAEDMNQLTAALLADDRGARSAVSAALMSGDVLSVAAALGVGGGPGGLELSERLSERLGLGLGNREARVLARVRADIRGSSYVIDVRDMTQRNSETGVKRKIRRRETGAKGASGKGGGGGGAAAEGTAVERLTVAVTAAARDAIEPHHGCQGDPEAGLRQFMNIVASSKITKNSYDHTAVTEAVITACLTSPALMAAVIRGGTVATSTSNAMDQVPSATAAAAEGLMDKVERTLSTSLHVVPQKVVMNLMKLAKVCLVVLLEGYEEAVEADEFKVGSRKPSRTANSRKQVR